VFVFSAISVWIRWSFQALIIKRVFGLKRRWAKTHIHADPCFSFCMRHYRVLGLSTARASQVFFKALLIEWDLVDKATCAICGLRQRFEDRLSGLGAQIYVELATVAIAWVAQIQTLTVAALRWKVAEVVMQFVLRRRLVMLVKDFSLNGCDLVCLIRLCLLGMCQNPSDLGTVLTRSALAYQLQTVHFLWVHVMMPIFRRAQRPSHTLRPLYVIK